MPKISKRNKFKGTPYWRKRNLSIQSTANVDELHDESSPTNINTTTNFNKTNKAELDEDSSDSILQPTITASERKLLGFGEQIRR